LYDSLLLHEYIDSTYKHFNEITSNIGLCLKDKSIKSIKRFPGGSGNRNLLEVVHDNNKITICEYKFTDGDKNRDELKFEQLVVIDKGYKLICSSLINENKLLIQHINTKYYYIFNMDMRILWKVSDKLQAYLDESSDHGLSVYFIP